MHKDVRNAYETLSETYDVGRDDTYFRIIESIEERAVTENISLGPETTLLDVGCDTGRFISRFGKHGAIIIGLDYTPSMINTATSKLPKEDMYLINGNAETLPFRDKTFDVVYSFKTLPHVPNLELAINEIKRVTKKKGIAILEFYNPLSFRRLVSKFNFYTSWHTPFRAKKIVRDSGLKIIRIYGVRTIIPAYFFCNIPMISQILESLESKIANTPLHIFSGYYILVCENTD